MSPFDGMIREAVHPRNFHYLKTNRMKWYLGNSVGGKISIVHGIRHFGPYQNWAICDSEIFLCSDWELQVSTSIQLISLAHDDTERMAVTGHSNYDLIRRGAK